MKLLVEYLAIYVCILGSQVLNCLTGDSSREREFRTGVANAATIRESYKGTSIGSAAWGGPFYPFMDLTKEDYLNLYRRRLNLFTKKLGYDVDFGNICQQLKIADTSTWMRELESVEEEDARKNYFYGPLVASNLLVDLTDDQKSALDEICTLSAEELKENDIVDISLQLDDGISLNAFELIVQLLEIRGATYDVASFLRGLAPEFQGLVIGLMNTSNFDLDVEVLENFFVAIDIIRNSFYIFSFSDTVRQINAMATKYPAVFAYRNFSHRAISNDAEEYAQQQLCWVLNVKYTDKLKKILQDITNSYTKSFGLPNIPIPQIHDSFKYALDMSNIIKKVNKSNVPDDIKLLTQRIDILRQYGVSNEPGRRICIQPDSTSHPPPQNQKNTITANIKPKYPTFTEGLHFPFPILKDSEIFRTTSHIDQTIQNYMGTMVNIS